MTRLTPLATLVPALMALSAGAAMAADTGDAPEGYGLASHVVVEGAAYLGRLAPDDDEGSLAGEFADGDDANGEDDEDGVFAFPVLVQNGKAYTTNVFATNPGDSPATLVGWVDFDGNGRFEADEQATATVPAGTDDEKFKLVWNDLRGISGPYFGPTYARFRIGTDALGGADSAGEASDGEVEDYRFDIQEDTDGDEIPNVDDPDNDNDGIPDEIEVIGTDTDGDGIEDALDTDSDGDGVPDFVEAGSNPTVPVDTDGDGTPDYRDLDSNDDGTPDSERVTGDADGDGIVGSLEGLGDDDGDGIPNTDDLDSDNDLIPDAVEAGADLAAPVDTDRDGVPDFLDVDSDNDGVFDLLESNGGELDVSEFDLDSDGRADSNRPGGLNGLDDEAETGVDSGIPRFVVVDSDGDGVRNYLDLDSDDDGVNDVVEAGGSDDDANGLVDALRDMDNDGIPDTIDVDLTGGTDTDGDSIDDDFDTDSIELDDADGDGIADIADLDVDGDGFVDAATNAVTAGRLLADTDDDGIPDLRDADAIGGDGTGEPVVDPTGPAPEVPTAPVVDENPVDNGAPTPNEPVDDASTAVGGIETGLSGYGGCSILASGSRDPLLPGLALATALLAMRRRRLTLQKTGNGRSVART